MVETKTSRIHILRPEESPIGVMVRPQIQASGRSIRTLNDSLDIGEEGLVNGVEVGTVLAGFSILAGFSMHILAPKGSVLCVRNRENNTYFGLGRSSEQSSNPDLEWWHAPIEVRQTKDAGWLYTVWQDRRKDPRISNSVSLWEVDENHVTMWEIGIVAPDGVLFYVAHDIRWDGQLFTQEGNVVGVPSDPAYGPFSVREDILDYKPFRALLPDALPKFCGSREDIEVPLGLPEHGFAIIEWWHMFMGMGQGQGVALLHDGSSAWVLGRDVEPGVDGVQRLVRGTKLTYTDVDKDGQGRRTLANPSLL